MRHRLPVAPSSPDLPLARTVELLADHDRLTRRALLRRLGAAGLATVPLAAAPLAAWSATCSVIPTETGGPYPGDGTNGPNALAQSGIVRSDIRPNFGSAGTAVAAGIPMTLTLQLVNADAGCAPLSGCAVYAWHCDAQGRYSMYSSGVTTQNFLRGVQVSDNAGNVRFTTIFPGCYAGRWPHIHFEIYRSAALASSGGNALKTTQLALPVAACQAVYGGAAVLYPSSSANLAQISLATDNVFSDGVTLQLATVTGTNADGYAATLQVGLAAGTATNNAVTVEFHNTTLDHYVMVTDPAEIAAIDAGAAGAGWVRTGKSFEFEPAPGSNSMPVYRFYGSVTPGPNSHFYTLSEAEKSQLIQIAAATAPTQPRWNYESAGGYWAGGASSAGACSQVAGAAYAVPVYRLYNNAFAHGGDSNHRYTGSTAVAADMVAQGWQLEGVVFCAVRYNT